MTVFKSQIRRPTAAMLLEAEAQRPIQGPSEEQVRETVLGLRLGKTSFVSLSDEAGNYVQVAGSRPCCVIEHRQLEPMKHERAFQDTPTPKYQDGAKLRTGAGDITMKHDEWFLLKDAAEVCVAFHRGDAFPPHVNWRSMDNILGLSE